MTSHTVTKGEKPLDVEEILKDFKKYKLIYYFNGYVKIITKDEKLLKKLKDIGFSQAE